MKIQIDTDNKIIRLENSINMGEFMEKINLLFPNDSWKEYKIETNTQVVWQEPIIVNQYPIYREPYPYWWAKPIYYGTTTNTETTYNNCSANTMLTSGTYNVEI